MVVTHGLGLVWSQFGWNTLTGCCACFPVALCHGHAGSRFLPAAGQREGLVVPPSLLSWSQVRPVKPGDHLAKNSTKWG